MTNDTTTLNGALRELGETMAVNLTTQGVASTWDEGLTTLAGKILDIQGGGSGYDGISLTGDKSILSAADSEYVTLTAQLMNGQSSAAVSGETVSFKVYKASDDTLIDTLTDDTDSTGLATVSYYGEGAGDIYIKAECTFVSETYSIEDTLYYNDGTKLSNVTVGSGVSCTVSEGAIRITTSSSGEKYVTYPLTFTNSDNFIIEFEIACTGTTQRTGFWLNNATTANGLWCCYEISQNKYSGGLRGSSINYSTSCSVGDIMKIKQENGVISVYANNTELISKETSFSSSTFQFGNYTNYGRVQCLKNIKVKPL